MPDIWAPNDIVIVCARAGAGGRMSRRSILVFSAGAMLAWPPLAGAEQTDRIPRLGFLGFGIAADQSNRVDALRAGLRDRGYIEGKNLIIEFRWSDTVEQMDRAATDLVRMNVDIIFATSSTEVESARHATKTIPIVFATHADPVGVGHAESLPRPGGNITGLADIQTDIAAKRLELLKETLPHATKFGVLWSTTAPSYRPFLQAAESAGPKLGIEFLSIGVTTAEDFDGALANMGRDGASAVLVHAAALTRVHRAVLAELALKYRLPTMFGNRQSVEAGGLMSYAPDHLDLTRRAAVFIDKILKGDQPSSLPIEQASRYQLVINFKTAGALGLTIPPSVLARMDDVIVIE